MADSPLTYLDAEERELIESIEHAPQLGRPVEPEQESRLPAPLAAQAARIRSLAATTRGSCRSGMRVTP